MGDLASTPVIADSITAVPTPVVGLPVICASHGGIYSAVCAASLGASAAVFNDAGSGRERAGVAGLDWLDDHGIAAVAVSHRTARIGDGRDCWERGVASTVNETALACGVRVGMRLPEIHALLPRGRSPLPNAQPPTEARHRLQGYGEAPVYTLDSNSLVAPDDAGAIVITGSHGGLLGGVVQTAIKHPVFAAFYNDAGVGIDDAGVSRLPALQTRGIAGIAVDAWSARIGDGSSTHDDGVVSFINDTARTHGVRAGMSVKDAVMCLAEAWNQHHTRRRIC